MAQEIRRLNRPEFDQALEEWCAASTPAQVDAVLKKWKPKLTDDEYMALLEAGESKEKAWQARKALEGGDS